MNHSLSTSNLWDRIQAELDQNLPDWRNLIAHFGQVQAIKDRALGKTWSDDEVQEALVKAVLSNNTDWAKIESVLSELNQLFEDYSLAYYAQLCEKDIQNRFVPWFNARNASSMTLEKDLKNLIKTSHKLKVHSNSTGSAEHYFTSLYTQCGQDPKRVALRIGRTDSNDKLPGFGVPLGAEALRNMGFDLAKPDRHILRAVGSFGLVSFTKWRNQSANKPPQPSNSELWETMTALEAFSASVGQPTAYIDNAIWLLCAKSGLWFSNARLTNLANK